MASLAALFALYDLDPGDTIYLDAGTYNLAKNIVIGSQDSGVRIVGPQTAPALLNRGNVGGSSFVLELQNADNVTLEHLWITGGYFGVYASPSSDSDDLTLLDNTIYGNAYIGVYLQGTTNDHATITGNTFYGLPASGNTDQNYGLAVDYGDSLISGNTFHDHASYGVSVGAKATVTGNTVYANSTGINASGNFTAGEQTIVSGNTVYGNYGAGIIAYGNVLIQSNTVYGQTNTNVSGINMSHGVQTLDNTVYDNYRGIDVQSSGGRVSGNRVFHNAQIGINIVNYDTPIEGNTVYSNSIGIQSTYHSGPIANNLIYSNTNQGLLVVSGAPRITNNTIYQQVGDAVRVQQGSNNVTLRNNILWVQAGYDIHVSADSQVGFNSDYNLLYTAGAGKLGFWEGSDYLTRGDWFYELGLDAHSLTDNPLLVNPAGSDGLLGYVAGVDHGLDDDFYDQALAPSIDAGDPASAYLNEPQPNGGRVNLGQRQYVQAAASPESLTSPLTRGPGKFEVGQPVTVQWRSHGAVPPALHPNTLLADNPLAYYRLSELSGTSA
jgi:parallel beta-helix repeat protein